MYTKANKQTLSELNKQHEIVKLLSTSLNKAHLKAEDFFLVTTNIRANSESEIAQQMLDNGLGGLQGPTVSTVYSSGLRSQSLYAASVCVRKTNLHDTIKSLRAMGGTGVLVSELTYIFDEEPWRWTELQKKLMD